MSHEPLDVLRARHARTQSPRDASDLVSALLRRGELVTISDEEARERDHGGIAFMLEEQGYRHIGQGIASGVGVWRRDQLLRVMPSTLERTYLLEWDLLGWRVTSRTSSNLLWAHDEHLVDDDYGTHTVTTHAPIEQTCRGRVMAIPVYMIELSDAAQTRKEDIARHHLSVPPMRPDLDLTQPDPERFAADFGPMMLPDLHALAREGVSERARYGTLRLLATLLFDANPTRPRDPQVTKLTRHGDDHFTLSCRYDGHVSLDMDTSTIDYAASLELTATPTSWSFSRAVTSRDIYFGMALS
jgi:hypothetical protein